MKDKIRGEAERRFEAEWRKALAAHNRGRRNRRGVVYTRLQITGVVIKPAPKEQP